MAMVAYREGLRLKMAFQTVACIKAKPSMCLCALAEELHFPQRELLSLGVMRRERDQEEAAMALGERERERELKYLACLLVFFACLA